MSESDYKGGYYQMVALLYLHPNQLDRLRAKEDIILYPRNVEWVKETGLVGFPIQPVGKASDDSMTDDGKESLDKVDSSTKGDTPAKANIPDKEDEEKADTSANGNTVDKDADEKEMKKQTAMRGSGRRRRSSG